MNKLLLYIVGPASPKILALGIAIIRIGIGMLTMAHGFPKLLAGYEEWHNIGTAIGLVGIHFAYPIWGFLSAATQTFGGLSYILGWGTRISSVPLSFMMVIAYLLHHAQGDPYRVYSHALALLAVYLGFIFIGSGAWSLDQYYYQGHKEQPISQRPNAYSPYHYEGNNTPHRQDPSQYRDF